MSTFRFTAPERLDESNTAINATTYRIDASGEKAVFIITVPKTGTLKKFIAYIGAVTNAPDNGLRFSFQDVDTSTGLPDGTVDQYATVASGSVTTGWLDPGDFDTTRSVSAGDLLAMVIDIPSFTTGDDVGVGSQTAASDQHIPYGVSATSTKQTNNLPYMVPVYDDGTIEYIDTTIWPGTVGSWTIQSDTTPDEVGLAFTVPRAWTLREVTAQLRATTGTAGITYDMVVYDASNTVLSTQTLYADVAASAATVRLAQFALDTPVTLSANTLYRVTFKPNSDTVNFLLYYTDFPTLAQMEAVQAGGVDWYATSRFDAGSWTNYNNSTDGYRRPRIYLHLEDDGTGGSSGGLMTHPGMSGGIRG